RELPGIAARCLRAYWRLKARKRFIQPRSADRLERDILFQSDPFERFCAERLIADPVGKVEKEKVRTVLEMWCVAQGLAELLETLKPNIVSKRLSAVFGPLGEFRPGGNGPRHYTGIRLRTKEERRATDE